MISERTWNKAENLCACFIDWQKALDSVNLTKLMQIKKNSIDWCGRRQISKLYMGQSVNLRLNQVDINVKTGKRC